MHFDLSRQPLVPAFLTLLAFAVLYVCTVRPTPDIPAAVRTETIGPTGIHPEAIGSGENHPKPVGSGAIGTQPDGQTVAPEAPGAPKTSAEPELPAVSEAAPAFGSPTAPASAGAGLAFTPPDRLPELLQTARSAQAKALAALLILFAGLTAGRLAVRYNLYAVATCLGIPLFGLIACAAGSGGAYLQGLVAAALLALSVKHFARSFCNGYAFDALFRAALYLSLTVLAAPAALPLLLLLPLAVVLFRRTLRETVVALAGLALCPLVLCYANWGAGGGFAAPLVQIGRTFLAGVPFGVFSALPPERLILPGAILLLDLAAVGCLLSDLYAVGTKARFILLFDLGVLLLAGAVLCGPAATTALFPLLALPSALLLPFLFVRMDHTISTAAYLFLAAAAAATALLQ